MGRTRKNLGRGTSYVLVMFWIRFNSSQLRHPTFFASEFVFFIQKNTNRILRSFDLNDLICFLLSHYSILPFSPASSVRWQQEYNNTSFLSWTHKTPRSWWRIEKDRGCIMTKVKVLITQTTYNVHTFWMRLSLQTFG